MDVDSSNSYWRKPIVEYLKNDQLPTNLVKAHKVRIQLARYTLINEILYRRSFNRPYLRCLGP